MEEKFVETQKFTQWWLWALLLTPLGYLTYDFFIRISKHGSDQNTTNYVLIACTLILTSIPCIFFYTYKLKTTINDQEIRIELPLLPSMNQTLPMNRIEKLEIKAYRDIGYGIRYDIKNNIHYYNIKGKTALYITCKNGNKLALGTQQANALSQYLKARHAEKAQNLTHTKVKKHNLLNKLIKSNSSKVQTLLSKLIR